MVATHGRARAPPLQISTSENAKGLSLLLSQAQLGDSQMPTHLLTARSEDDVSRVAFAGEGLPVAAARSLGLGEDRTLQSLAQCQAQRQQSSQNAP